MAAADFCMATASSGGGDVPANMCSPCSKMVKRLMAAWWTVVAAPLYSRALAQTKRTSSTNPAADG